MALGHDVLAPAHRLPARSTCGGPGGRLPDLTGGAGEVRDAAAEPRVYSPRRPHRTSLYRILEEHFEEYQRVHADRYEPRWGPLRGAVPKAVHAYLDCGRLHGGFARVRCPDCGREYLLTYSCRTRCLCPSCQTKRAVLFGEKLAGDILAPVPHRHLVFTMPRCLRGLFRRERRLLGTLARCAFKALRLSHEALLDRGDVVPGCVAAIHTYGNYAANWHPHIHALASDGAFALDGTFFAIDDLDTSVVAEIFRRLVIGSLVAEERLSEEFAGSLLSWQRSGFDVHAGSPLRSEDRDGVEALGHYMARAPLRLDAVEVCADGSVLVETPRDPRTGATSREMDPLDFIDAVVAHVPDAYQHVTRFYGAYSNAGRRAGPRTAPIASAPQPDAARASLEEGESDELARFMQRRRASWARLIQKVFEVDPLLCSCGGSMRVVALISASRQPDVVARIRCHLSRRNRGEGAGARAPP